MLNTIKAAAEKWVTRLMQQATEPFTKELFRIRRDIFNSPFMAVRCIYPLRKGDRAIINLVSRTVMLLTQSMEISTASTSICICEVRRDIPEGRIVPFNVNDAGDEFTPFNAVVRLI